MSSGFASTADLADKTITFDAIGPDLYAFTAEGDPNSGIIVGDDGVMVVDAQATPVMAQQVIDRVKKITDKPIKYVLLTHYHAVRVLGASAYAGAEILASAGTRGLIAERGKADMDSEIGRFPRLFRAVESIPGLTWPSITFPDDLVEYHSACYCGDAHFTDWPATLDRLAEFSASALVPGRGAALKSAKQVAEGIALTEDFLTTLYDSVSESGAKGRTLKEAYDEARRAMDPKFASFAIYEHCMPFNVSRAYDEAKGIEHPVIWTAERDRAMWAALRG